MTAVSRTMPAEGTSEQQSIELVPGVGGVESWHVAGQIHVRCAVIAAGKWEKEQGIVNA